MDDKAWEKARRWVHADAWMSRVACWLFFPNLVMAVLFGVARVYLWAAITAVSALLSYVVWNWQPTLFEITFEDDQDDT